MRKLDEILFKIECLRSEMHRLASLKGLDDPIVLESSRRLDKALNEYQHLKAARKEPMLKIG